MPVRGFRIPSIGNAFHSTKSLTFYFAQRVMHNTNNCLIPSVCLLLYFASIFNLASSIVKSHRLSAVAIGDALRLSSGL